MYLTSEQREVAVEVPLSTPRGRSCVHQGKTSKKAKGGAIFVYHFISRDGREMEKEGFF